MTTMADRPDIPGKDCHRRAAGWFQKNRPRGAAAPDGPGDPFAAARSPHPLSQRRRAIRACFLQGRAQ